MVRYSTLFTSIIFIFILLILQGSPTTMGKQEREGEAETFSNRIMQIKK